MVQLCTACPEFWVKVKGLVIFQQKLKTTENTIKRLKKIAKLHWIHKLAKIIYRLCAI